MSHSNIIINGWAESWTLVAWSVTAATGLFGGGFMLGKADEAMRRGEMKETEGEPPAETIPPGDRVAVGPCHLLLSASGSIAQLASALQAMSLALELKADTASWDNSDLGSGEFDLLVNPTHPRISNEAVIRAAALGMLDVFDHEGGEASSSASRMEGEGVSGL